MEDRKALDKIRGDKSATLSALSAPITEENLDKNQANQGVDIFPHAALTIPLTESELAAQKKHS
jgi:hypothetical protein